jgi:hypothetical protein
MRYDSPIAIARSCEYLLATQRFDRRVYFAYDADESEFFEQLPRLQNTIMQAKTQTEARGARFLLVYAPVKFRVVAPYCQIESKSLLATFHPDDLPQRMERFARDSEIHYINLEAALAAATAKGRLPYFPDDGHWDADGHTIASEAIAEAAQRMRL